MSTPSRCCDGARAASGRARAFIILQVIGSLTEPELLSEPLSPGRSCWVFFFFSFFKASLSASNINVLTWNNGDFPSRHFLFYAEYNKNGGVEQNTLEMKLCVCVWRTDVNLKGVFIRGEEEKKRCLVIFYSQWSLSRSTSQLWAGLGPVWDSAAGLHAGL